LVDNTLNNITIYPNPTEGRLNLSGLTGPVNLEIYSIEGKLLKHYQSIENFIDLELTSGLYLLKLTSDQKSIIRKIIID
jgi:hypothetical protein